MMIFGESGRASSVASRGARNRGGQWGRPVAEVLEGRQLLSTITVNTTDDSDGADGSSTLSLRQAIEISNGTLSIGSLSEAQAALVSGPLGSFNTIDFDIPGTGPFVISPTSSLPPLTSPVVIDGYSEPGAHPNTNGPRQGKNTVLEIELDGTNAGADSIGLEFEVRDSTIQGLAIGGFGSGISFLSSFNPVASGNAIQGDFIGTDVTGTQALPNGLGISGVTESETIGGTDPSAGNLISGNTGIGVAVDDSNLIQGNFVGTDITGTKALPNGGDGIELISTSNSVGGTTPGAGNLISGNTGNGVSSQLGVYTLQGNFIGTDVTGTKALANGLDGVGISPTTVTGFGRGATIGGTASGAGNVISGNANDGLLLAFSNLLEGNFIGTDLTGTIAIPNGNAGVELPYGSDTIGGTALGAGNVISGNAGNGILSESSANLIQGNFIGTDITGTKAVPNGNAGYGVLSYILGATGFDTIGGTAAGAGNVISGNIGDGLVISSSSMVQGNFIGTDVTGTKALPNGYDGINILSFVETSGTDFQIFHASSDTIGGTAAGAGNVISGNGNDGLEIANSSLVQGNFIGTDINGLNPLPNSGNGVYVIGTANTIGGTVAGAANVIDFNGGAGVYDASTFQGTSLGTTISGNSIYANKQLGINLGNGITPNNPNGSPNTPNRAQPYPVLTSAALNGSGTLISATLDALPSTSYTIEFFSNPVADPSGFGQGKTYLGSIVATTDASGHASFSFASNQNLLSQAISATATDPSGDTSEFAQDVTAGYMTSTSLIGPGQVATLGVPTTFAAVVTGPFGAVPTADVNFLEDGVVIGSSPVNASGVAVFITKGLSPGLHTITAEYAGDFILATSQSNVLALDVFAKLAFGGPSVTSVSALTANTLTIGFNRGLLLGPAVDPTNFKIIGPGGHAITVVSAVYDPKTARVTLTTLQKLVPGQSYQLTINGEKGDRVLDVFGIPLNGQKNGKPGHDYVGKFTVKKAPVVKAAHPSGPKPKAPVTVAKKGH